MGRTNPPPRAGKTFNVGDPTSASCLTFETRPTTPEEVRQYRKSYFSEPGARIAHPGLIQDVKKFNPMTKFGVSTSVSQHIEDILSNAPTSEFQRINEQKAEANYTRHTREPLGKAYSRHHVLPSHMQKPEYAFGISGTFGESAKELLYPSTCLNNKQEEAMYKKSHGSMEPGEQKNRQYSWDAANIDPTKFRFGLKKTIPGMDGVATAAVLNPEMDETQSQPSVITAVQVQDMRNTLDQLGKPRHIGAASTNLPPTHTFGIRLIKDDENAKDCIQGHYSLEDQQPDPDLGKPLNYGWKNSNLDSRSFGIPSVRSDIPIPQRRSIADAQNYGDDCSSKELLYPEEFSSSGIRDVEFSQPREQKYLEQLFIHQMGYHLPVEALECIWNNACKRSSSRGSASIVEYRDAVNDYLEAQERGSNAMTTWRQQNQTIR